MNRFILCSLIAASFTLASAAHADLYGYVDSAGQVHLAPKKLDERYQLFQKSPPAELAVRKYDALADATRPGLGTTLSRDIAKAARTPLTGLPSAEPRLIKASVSAPYNKMINKVAREMKLDAQLLHSIVSVESGYDALAVSPKGAIGLMQVIPETGERFGVADLTNPDANVRAGARYLKFLLGLFNHDMPLVIAAYNAGEGAVQKYKNTIPPYPETRNYVSRVLATYEARSGKPALQTAVSHIDYNRGKRVRAVLEPL
ncbi:lytic transglycosylase domain-containing protein [Craterilacuibacter sinensis]|uniref:Transglycosylase SLT domain-containing protein n=1 Tax=Craterilacuibacter sinensis TaxID=2686017 RepID=A0A845BNJ1_9NEIS|nr:lytic transglycosylase domain-containing protein [Craterilacuibacter sinensis]MXR36021.1 transglycosylase SLT domain-containing protein [Craterilacuibacter sinensis]RQW28308.1 lytic transglycosylase domain-containing protein [Rhodobacteraceae bacterium CH30]